jgi:hypothetical protein
MDTPRAAAYARRRVDTRGVEVPKKTLEELQAMALEERLQAILAEGSDEDPTFAQPNWPSLTTSDSAR